MRIAACPNPAALERLFLGGLPAAEADAIERHVLECDACSDRLEQLFRANEPLSAVLRAKAGADSDERHPAVDDLIKKVESLHPASVSLPQGNAMIDITCASCQKKHSVKEDLAGKKVKCPGCGQLVAVPVAVAAGHAETPTLLPPAPRPGAGVDAAPTHPPSEKADATLAATHDPRYEPSLTDFLSPPQAPDELGRLGKYRILKILGHGGMGVVYKAEDLKLKRTVAVKAMLPTLAASASCGKRFMREAEAMAAVEHDHIVRIYQVDDERGVPFMAMEFLKGEPLDDRLNRDEQLPLEEILRIGREIAEGLSAAHSTGLIHRDIKPGNIWLEAKGEGRGASTNHLGPQPASLATRVKILDFGLARAASQQASLTQQGAIIGTPAYMSPEQGRGENVDARTDLFSLGVVLYRMCTGQQPFQGKDTVSTLMAVAMIDPAPPIKINQALPAELSELVMKLLEKDTAKRTGSAAEVVQAIQAIEKKLAWQKLAAEKTKAANAGNPRHGIKSGEPRGARDEKNQESTGDAAPAPMRRKMRPVALAVAAVFAVLCLLGAGGIFYWQTNNGIVIVEINDPEIQVSFDKKDLIFKGADQQEIRVGPGEFGMHVKRGDLEFDTDKPIIVKRGDVVRLKVSYQVSGKNDLGQFIKKIAVEQGDKELGKKEVTVTPPPPIPIPPAPGPRHALAFSGDKSYVEFPTLKIAENIPFTAEAWAVLDRPGDPGGSEDLIGNANSSGFAIGVSPAKHATPAFAGKAWGMNIFSPKDSDTKTYAHAWEKARLPRQQWIHLAGVYDGVAEIRFYVNGQLQSRAPAKDVRPSTMPLHLGANFNGNSGFIGRVCEVRISKIARYDKDFTPAKRWKKDSYTIALYDFDEGSGDMLHDSSGNNHDGKLVGAKWVKADGLPIGPWEKLLDAKLTGWEWGDGGQSDVIAALQSEGEPVLRLRRDPKNGAWVASKRLLQDHHLRLEFQLPGNEPTLFYAGYGWGPAGKSMLQFQIAGNGSTKRAVNGARWHEAVFERGVLASTGKQGPADGKLADAILEPAGAWNRLDLVRVGDRVACFVNRRFVGAVADLRDGKDGKETEVGKISIVLACATGEVLFRRIEVRDISTLPPELAGAPFRPLDPAWLKAVAAMKPEQQIEAVRAELMKRNPGYDGKFTSNPIEKDNPVRTLMFLANEVADISRCAR